MGGNAGTQTLTVVVRGIALGELTWSNSRKALLKEALVGIGNGVVLGLVAALVVWATRGNPVLGVVLGLAMVINMFVAATAGTLVPLGLRAVNIDPALASSVFITTMTDVFGFFSFLGLAAAFRAVPAARLVKTTVKYRSSCPSTPPTPWFCAPTPWARPIVWWCS